MDDVESKVTLRPRSKLERLVEVLSGTYPVPGRPGLALLTQLVILQLVGAGADPRAALAAIGPLCDEDGGVDPAKLATTSRELVASVCEASAVDDTLASLRVAGTVAREGNLDERCRPDLELARKLLRSLPSVSEQRADLLLLYAAVQAVVAPTATASRVLARIGYPGASYASVARAVDEELPGPTSYDFAWRAHHVLDQHGRTLCAPKAPECWRCPVRDACAFRGIGEDPAARLVGRTEG